MSAFRRPLAVLLLLLAASCAPAVARGSAAGLPAPPERRELVVLVHGMGRTPLSMLPLERRLEREGYEVLNWGYSSTCCAVAELGARLRRAVEDHPARANGRVHFVSHSLGGILVRRVLAEEDLPFAPGRVVMLAPPNQGSRAADRLAPALGWLLRPLPELRTAAMRSAPSLALAPELEVGVIAGRYDAKVSVAESRLEGMDGHVVVPATHGFLMFRGDVQRRVLEFLRDGAFSPPRDPPSHALPGAAP